LLRTDSGKGEGTNDGTGRLEILEYSEKELVRIAKRENNKKRNYLVVNPRQGKHIPVSPSEALELFGQLARQVKDLYKEEKLLTIGFAETATAIGAHVASCLGTSYIQTTREEIPGVHYLYFSETHSHATEQKLVKEDMDEILPQIDRILFVEDEVTTGNTILNIMDVMERTYSRKFQFSVASLLNGMDEEALSSYKDRGAGLHYILKTDHSGYPQAAEQFGDDGKYREAKTTCSSLPAAIKAAGWMNARRLVDANRYQTACEELWKVIEKAMPIESGKKYLVVGTEEFMYPALYVGKKMEELGGWVRTHSTTRSPIMVSSEAAYPLHTRYELKSLYDKERTTYLYEIGKYDKVLVLTDAQNEESEGVCSLYQALSDTGGSILTVRWC